MEKLLCDWCFQGRTCRTGLAQHGGKNWTQQVSIMEVWEDCRGGRGEEGEGRWVERGRRWDLRRCSLAACSWYRQCMLHVRRVVGVVSQPACVSVCLVCLPVVVGWSSIATLVHSASHGQGWFYPHFTNSWWWMVLSDGVRRMLVIALERLIVLIHSGDVQYSMWCTSSVV